MDARGILLFLHLLGLALWFGVTLTLAMVTVKARRSGEWAVTAFAYRASCEILKGPGLVGMILTVGSGVALTFVGGYAWFQPFPAHWLFQMQVLGTIAFLLALLVQIPNADRLARAAEASATAGEASASFVRFRKVNAVVGSFVGLVIAVLILLGALRP